MEKDKQIRDIVKRVEEILNNTRYVTELEIVIRVDTDGFPTISYDVEEVAFRPEV